MRRLFCVLLATALAVAGPDKERAERGPVPGAPAPPHSSPAPAPPGANVKAPAPNRKLVRRLVALLGHSRPARRSGAHRRLAAMGEAIVPMLQDVATSDPEIKRRLRWLTRSVRRMRLVLLKAPKTIAYGEALVIEVELRNDSDYAWRIPLTVRQRRKGKVTSTLFLSDGARRTSLRPDQVPGARKGGLLTPGAGLVVAVRFAPEDLPFRKPGLHRLTVGYWSKVAWFAGATTVPEHGESKTLALETTWFDIECTSRTPQQLDAALRSPDAKKRAPAILELRLRDDDALLPVLRRNLDRVPEVGFRRRAIRRLGRNAAEEDLPAIIGAIRDPDREVVLAAIAGLGGYPGWRKARSRLLRMTDDHTYRLAAVQALRHHPHSVCVRRFIGLLERQTDPVVAKELAAALTAWTGLPVTTRLTEVRRLKAWWGDPRNRREFAKRHRR